MRATPEDINYTPAFRRLSTSNDLGLPGVDFWYGRVVWAVRAACPGQVFHPWLFPTKRRVSRNNDEQTGDSPPSRMATKSSSRRPPWEGVGGCAAATNATLEGPASRCCSAAKSRPICDDLVMRVSGLAGDQTGPHTWNFILRVRILKVAVAEPGRTVSSLRRWTM